MQVRSLSSGFPDRSNLSVHDKNTVIPKFKRLENKCSVVNHRATDKRWTRKSKKLFRGTGFQIIEKTNCCQ
jgi:hypothetical protein